MIVRLYEQYHLTSPPLSPSSLPQPIFWKIYRYWLYCSELRNQEKLVCIKILNLLIPLIESEEQYQIPVFLNWLSLRVAKQHDNNNRPFFASVSKRVQVHTQFCTRPHFETSGTRVIFGILSGTRAVNVLINRKLVECFNEDFPKTALVPPTEILPLYYNSLQSNCFPVYVNGQESLPWVQEAFLTRFLVPVQGHVHEKKKSSIVPRVNNAPCR